MRRLQGPQLERVLQKIVFRLDAIEDALESHALLKEMRQLHAAVRASEHADQVRKCKSALSLLELAHRLDFACVKPISS